MTDREGEKETRKVRRDNQSEGGKGRNDTNVRDTERGTLRNFVSCSKREPAVTDRDSVVILQGLVVM